MKGACRYRMVNTLTLPMWALWAFQTTLSGLAHRIRYFDDKTETPLGMHASWKVGLNGLYFCTLSCNVISFKVAILPACLVRHNLQSQSLDTDINPCTFKWMKHTNYDIRHRIFILRALRATASIENNLQNWCEMKHTHTLTYTESLSGGYYYHNWVQRWKISIFDLAKW